MVDVCLLQTRLQYVDEENVFSLWGNKKVECTTKWIIGRSGGLITMYKAGIFEVSFSFAGEELVGINVAW